MTHKRPQIARGIAEAETLKIDHGNRILPRIDVIGMEIAMHMRG